MNVSVGWDGTAEVLATAKDQDDTFYLLDKYQLGTLAFPLNYGHQVWEGKPTDHNSKLRGEFDDLEDAKLFMNALFR